MPIFWIYSDFVCCVLTSLGELLFDFDASLLVLFYAFVRRFCGVSTVTYVRDANDLVHS